VKNRKDISTPCVIWGSEMQNSPEDDTVTDLEVIEPVRKLLALGLSMKEIEDLDIKESTLQAICEYARLECSDSGASVRISDAVETISNLLNDQLENLDMEIEMLNLRRRALKKRTKALQKLSQISVRPDIKSGQ